MSRFINLKTVVLLLFSTIILGACSSNDSFEIFISGHIVQENNAIDSTRSFTPYIQVFNLSDSKINQVSVKHGSSSLLQNEISADSWVFLGYSTRNLESLNGTYTATASDENDNIDIKEMAFNFRNEEALGFFDINTFSFDGDKITVKGDSVENAMYYILNICVGEEKEGEYVFSDLNWKIEGNSSTVLNFTTVPSISHYQRGQQIRVAIVVVAGYQKGYMDIISRSDFKTIEVGKSNFLEDELTEE